MALGLVVGWRAAPADDLCMFSLLTTVSADLPLILGTITAFTILLSSVQSIVAAAVLTAALVSLVHFYAAVAVGALLILAGIELGGWYARTTPGRAYTGTDHASIAQFHLRYRGRR